MQKTDLIRFDRSFLLKLVRKSLFKELRGKIPAGRRRMSTRSPNGARIHGRSRSSSSRSNGDLDAILVKCCASMRAVASSMTVEGDTCTACTEKKINTAVVHGDSCHRSMCVSCCLEMVLHCKYNCAVCRERIEYIVTTDDDRVCKCGSACQDLFLWKTPSGDAYVVSPECSSMEFSVKVCKAF